MKGGSLLSILLIAIGFILVTIGVRGKSTAVKAALK